MDPSVLDFLRCPRSGQRLQLEATRTAPDGGVQFGTLTAAGFTYPIAAGIPILTTDTDAVSALIDRDHLHEAVTLAALGTANSRTLPFLDAAAELRGVGRPAAAAARWERARQLGRNVERLFGSPPAAEPCADPVELVLIGGRHPTIDGFHYFRYRFGTPRYLVALGLVDALPAPQAPTLDVGCGAGHLAWALTQRTAAPVLGADPSFGQLLTASRLAPRATFVCADGRALPFANGAFARVVSSDVLPYVAEKPTAVRELVRVLSTDGQLLLTALRNASQRHVFGGEPLMPRNWVELVELPHVRLFADDHVLDRYLQRLAPGDLGADGDVDVSQTVSIVAGHVDPPVRSGRWPVWPHARGPLATHPLLYPEGNTAAGVVHVRRFPSATYAEDNARIAEYLPERCVVPAGPLPDGATVSEADEAIGSLISSIALLARPSDR